MIFGVFALPLLPVVWMPNLHGEVVTRVVPASTDPMGFIPEDTIHMSSCLPLLTVLFASSSRYGHVLELVPLHPLLYGGSCKPLTLWLIFLLQLCNDMFMYVMNAYALVHVYYDNAA